MKRREVNTRTKQQRRKEEGVQVRFKGQGRGLPQANSLRCGRSTCVISQGRHRALWWKHALHSAGLLGVVEAEEIGLAKTQGITWNKETRTLRRNYRPLPL